MRNYEFKADIEGWSIQGYDQGVQWDTDSNQLEFSIYRRGKAATEYDGGSVVATILRDSDKAQIITNADIEGNKASIIIPNNAFYNKGDRLTIQFTINKDSQQLTIANKMFIEVIEKMVGEDVEDDDRLPILDQKIIEVEELHKETEELITELDERNNNPRFPWIDIKRNDTTTNESLELRRNEGNLWYYIGNRIAEKWLRFKDNGVLQWTGEFVASMIKIGDNEVYHPNNKPTATDIGALRSTVNESTSTGWFPILYMGTDGNVYKSSKVAIQPSTGIIKSKNNVMAYQSFTISSGDDVDSITN